MPGESFLKDLHPEKIITALRDSFPDLADYARTYCNEIELLGSGFGSQVVLFESTYIFRIAKHPQAMQGHLLERQILPRIAADLPIRIPEPIWQQQTNEHFPFGVSGYRYIPGIPFSPDHINRMDHQSIAQQLAEFLLALHQIPLAQVQDCGLRDAGLSGLLSDEIIAALAFALDKAEQNKLVSWWEAGLETVIDQFTPRLLHGDFWYENMILDENLKSLVGVVDFESMAIGDIAHDLAPLEYLGEEFTNLVVTAYRELGGTVENNLILRMQRALLLREFNGLVYAVQYPESLELADSLTKIRRLATSIMDRRREVPI